VYAARLAIVLQHMQRTQPGLQMHTMLQKGRSLVKGISAMYASGSSRCAALTAALAVYRASKRLRREHEHSWAVLKRAMVSNRCIEAQRYKTGQASARQKVNYVSMPEILQKLEQLTQEGTFRTDFTAHQRWLLVACCAMLVPKRNDLGSCQLWEHAPAWATAAGSTTNFIELRPRARLVLNRWRKTWAPGAKPVIEKIHPVLAKLLRASLQLFPREWLFLDTRGSPFSRPNSFGVWFKRQCAAVFDGRALSTTLLRHSYVNALDLRMSKAARAAVAKLLLHTPEQTPAYRLNVGAPSTLRSS
jgi:hypothetical protein